jgi:hypothetical protein
MSIQAPKHTQEKLKRRLMSFKQFIASSHAKYAKQSKLNREPARSAMLTTESIREIAKR